MSGGGAARPGRIAAWAVSLALLLAVAACSEKPRPPVAKAQPGPVAAAEQRSGDPERGYRYVVNGSYMSCGLPYRAWLRAAGAPEPGPSLSGRSERNSRLPYSLSLNEDPNGVEVVSANCLLCHAANFDGELVIGLGNEWLDFTGDADALVNAVGAYVSGEAETAAWRKWADRIGAIAPYSVTDTVGVNPAPNITLALIAHHDAETLAWSDEPLLEPPPQKPLPVSVPPWWRVGKKHAMFYNAMGRGDHARYMMMKSLLCAGSVAEAEAVDEQFVQVRAYLASLQAPRYPFAIDAELAGRGKAVFEKTCSACHGTYGDEASYPNLLVDLDTVGTDPAYARQSYADADRFMDWFNRSWYGELASARPAPGYIAPPLDGIWATAPFLHNGSVPSVATLLDSARRPTYWLRDFDAPQFDEDTLGWNYRSLSTGKQGIEDPVERKRLYDTTLPGYSNSGHRFGDGLSDDDRRAVIEYLKTL
jgi:mono/diheme cytochrome c family protein